MKVRIIPVLTVAGGKLVKTIQFQNPRNLNSPMAAVRNFNHRNVDEMVILFIDGRIDFDLLDQVSRECFMPLAVGGGIKTMGDVDKLFALGADKVVIRTHVELIPAVVEKYGAQAVIWSVDYPSGQRSPEAPECGEVLLTNITRDGVMSGYDLSVLRQFRDAIPRVPIIANGGAGMPKHFLEAYRAGASALAASSIWFYTQHTPDSVKEHLRNNGIPVRR